ncbi:hypothetical protein DOZ80_21920 [Pseudomonas fluorescens]|uniref:Uncharacterized protein n=1 Tax=Pseudomonas fluorescens TaxID=294 RepID=A0A327MU14_PSEFL|nr:hypothetical protein DOZ80_21920 [Pseudomonas fluorescens]
MTINPFEGMRIFCQVMESGSFTAAADQFSAPLSFGVAHPGRVLPLFLQRYREVTAGERNALSTNPPDSHIRTITLLQRNRK